MASMPQEVQDALWQWLQSVPHRERMPGSPEWEKMAGFLLHTMAGEQLRPLIMEGKPLPPEVAENLPPDRVYEIEDHAKGLRGESTTPAERTIKAQADAWLAVQERMVPIGYMTAARFSNVRIQISHAVAYFGQGASVETINAARITGFYGHVLDKIAGKEWSRAYARETFATIRRWVQWVAEQGTIAMPTNIRSRFRFGVEAKAIPTWTVEEIRYVLGEAPDRMRLFLLLMLNIGATQKDIADLRDNEVDWNEGRITRKRSKTGRMDSTPVVSYLLWPETLELLKRFRSGQETVLLTETGRSLVRQELRDGKFVSADIIASNYAHLQKRLGFKKSLKLLRKTGASTLAEHPSYRGFAAHYLSQAPTTMADRHYVRPPRELFDEAIHWLGTRLGFVS
jgi:integrase